MHFLRRTQDAHLLHTEVSQNLCANTKGTQVFSMIIITPLNTLIFFIIITNLIYQHVRLFG